MKTNYFFKNALLATALMMAGSVWGQNIAYTLECTKNSGNSAYATYYDVTINKMTWNAPGNQTIGAYWRIGGKSLTAVDRTITSKTAMGSAIGKITLSHNGISNSNLTVNSISVTVASDADFTSVIDNVTVTSPSLSTGTAGTIDFEPSSGITWNSGSFYKITINVTNNNASKNYGLDVTKIDFYAAASTSSVATPQFSVEGGTYTETQSVEITCATEGATIYYTTNGDTPTAGSTTYGNAISISTTTTLKAIAISGEESSAVATATYTLPTQVGNIAAFNALTDDIFAKITGTVTVVAVLGSNVYIQDNSGATLIYDATFAATGGLANGKTLTGLAGTKGTHNNAAQMKNVIAPALGEGTAVEPAEMTTLATTDVHKYVKLTNAKFSQAYSFTTDSTINATLSTHNGLTVRNSFHNFTLDVTTEGTYEIIGFVGIYNDAAQIYPVSITQEGVLPTPTATDATDITANSFTANWNAVKNATSYELSVWTENVGLNEDFSESDATGGNDGTWKGISGSSAITSYTDWTFENGNNASGCIRLGTSSKQGSATTPALGVSGNVVLTFRAGAWDSDSETLQLSLTGSGTLSTESVTLSNAAFSSYTVTITGVTAETKITFKGNSASYSRFFLDDVKVAIQNPVSGSPFTVAEASHTVTGLSAATTYYYSVVAKANDYTDSEASNVIELTTSGGTGTGLCRPAAVEGISFDGRIIRNAAGVELSVYTVGGLCVKTSTGDVDMSAMPHGIYLVRTQAGTLKITK